MHQSIIKYQEMFSNIESPSPEVLNNFDLDQQAFLQAVQLGINTGEKFGIAFPATDEICRHIHCIM